MLLTMEMWYKERAKVFDPCERVNAMLRRRDRLFRFLGARVGGMRTKERWVSVLFLVPFPAFLPRNKGTNNSRVQGVDVTAIIKEKGLGAKEIKRAMEPQKGTGEESVVQFGDIRDFLSSE